MPRPVNALMVLLCLLTGPLAYAGAAPMSESTVDGYFLGDGGTAYVSTHLSESALNALKKTCSRAGPIWTSTSRAPSQCTAFTYIEEGGDGPVYELTLAIRDRSPGPYLFSIRQFDSYDWKERSPTAAEQDAIGGLLRKSPNYNKAIQALRNKQIVAIDARSMGDAGFIVPWMTEVNHAMDISNDKFVVVARVGGRYRITGDFAGDYYEYVDINGDGFPEVRSNEDCDGICQYVISLYPKVAPLVWITVH